MKRFLIALLLFTLPALPAWAVVDPALVKQLAAEDSDAKIAAIQQLGASGDRDALKVLKALANDTLMATPDGRVFLMPEGRDSETVRSRSRWLAQICSEFEFSLSDRLHIHLWGDTRGT